MTDLLKILDTLIQFESITPEDKGCQEFMIQFLENLGFSCLKLNNPPVSNFFASYGTKGPLLVFAGHTDVVPIGEATQWNSNPFALTFEGDKLYGRGVADMKGSLACMLKMAERWVNTHPHTGRLGFLITSGEEGDEFHLGTPYVMTQLQERGIGMDYCIIGEPSSTHDVGDTIKIGRRGSLSAKINLSGKQGHVAYPHLAENPIHRISPVLTQLVTKQWDEGNLWFPPTSMQITHIHSGGHAANIIPGELILHFNFRFSTERTHTSLMEETTQTFMQHNLDPNINWRLNGQPFLTPTGLLLEASKRAILRHTGLHTESSTSGGTSDGRFIAPYGVEVVEIGPLNASIHQVNEWVRLKDLETLEHIYFSVSEQLLL